MTFTSITQLSNTQLVSLAEKHNNRIHDGVYEFSRLCRMELWYRNYTGAKPCHTDAENKDLAWQYDSYGKLRKTLGVKNEED